MAFFANSGSAPGILGELLASALNGNGMLWKSCPAIVELEQVTLRWLRQWTGLPDRKSTRLNSSHLGISYAVFCLKKKIVSKTTTFRIRDKNHTGDCKKIRRTQ